MKSNQQFSFLFLATISSSLLLFACDARRLCSSAPSSCGSIRNISYPFRLKTDPPNCGTKACELSCEANQTFIYLESVGRYYVDSISYEYQTIRLIDLELANSTCSPFSRKILTNNVEGAGISYSSDHLVVYFLNCSRSIENRTEFRALPCLNSSQDLYYYFYYYVGQIITLQDLNDPSNCHIVAAAPLPYYEWSYGNNSLWKNVSFSQIRSWLPMGFDLWWPQIIALNCAFVHEDIDPFRTFSCIDPLRRGRVSGEPTGDGHLGVDPASEDFSSDPEIHLSAALF